MDVNLLICMDFIILRIGIRTFLKMGTPLNEEHPDSCGVDEGHDNGGGALQTLLHQRRRGIHFDLGRVGAAMPLRQEEGEAEGWIGRAQRLALPGKAHLFLWPPPPPVALRDCFGSSLFLLTSVSYISSYLLTSAPLTCTKRVLLLLR